MTKNSMGSFLAALRRASGMTQQEVADRLNVSNKAVSRWERDECAPDLSLIPALAEMFGVTCDELLRGERMAAPQQRDGKIQKQRKALVSRALSRFRTFMLLAVVLAVAGFVAMLGISYGFYRPIVGFMVMTVFVLAGLVLATVGVTQMKELKENELLEDGPESLLQQLDRSLGKLSYGAYCSLALVVFLSLPLLIRVSGFSDAVLSFGSYLKLILLPLAGLAALMVLLKDFWYAWMTGRERPRRTGHPLLWRMNSLQLGALVLAAILVYAGPYCIAWQGGDTVCTILWLLALGLMVGNILIFVLFQVKYPQQRQELKLSGLRNMLLVLPTALVFKVHSIYYIYNNGYTGQEHIWQEDYLLLILILVALILGGSKLLELRKKKKI